jgi:hypothetical protein
MQIVSSVTVTTMRARIALFAALALAQSKPGVGLARQAARPSFATAYGLEPIKVTELRSKYRCRDLAEFDEQAAEHAA